MLFHKIGELAAYRSTRESRRNFGMDDAGIMRVNIAMVMVPNPMIVVVCS